MRAFRNSDYDIKANKYTEHYLAQEHAQKIIVSDKRVFEDGESKAIIGFLNYNQNNYYGFFIINETFEARCIPMLKECIEKLSEEVQADRLETESIACKEIDKWHKALGFELEGTKTKSYNGQDMNIWRILWNRS